MTEDTNLQTSEEQQILEETVFNEKIIEHPKLGKIKLRMPTLEIQRKIDVVARKRKKILKSAVDEIEDELDPSKITRTPAYKSRDMLKKEYKELGWWTDEQEDRLQSLSEEYLKLLTELELLEFNSEDEIYSKAIEIINNLNKHFEKHENYESELKEVINSVCSLGQEYDLEGAKKLRQEALSTEADEYLEDLRKLRKLYETFMDMLEVYTEYALLQTEYTSLFSDSWQDQLQYYIRLAQVFYCSSNENTGEPLWPSVAAIEKEEDLNLVRWIFSELNAFWQGLSDEVREKLEKYSFMPGLIEKPEILENSPNQSQSNEDGELQGNGLISSSTALDIAVD